MHRELRHPSTGRKGFCGISILSTLYQLSVCDKADFKNDYIILSNAWRRKATADGGQLCASLMVVTLRKPCARSHLCNRKVYCVRAAHAWHAHTMMACILACSTRTTHQPVARAQSWRSHLVLDYYSSHWRPEILLLIPISMYAYMCIKALRGLNPI